jgi:hypothetical protein
MVSLVLLYVLQLFNTKHDFPKLFSGQEKFSQISKGYICLHAKRQ